MFEKRLRTFNKNKKLLLSFAGYKSIQEARKNNVGFTDKEIYFGLLEDYNQIYDDIQKEIKSANNKKKSELNKFEIPIKSGITFLSTIRNTLSKFIGKNVVVKYITKNGVILDFEVYVPQNFSSWWKKNWFLFVADTDTTLFDLNGEGHFFIYPETIVVTNNFITQNFRDGVNHCVFTPIRNWIVERIDESKAEKTKSNYKTIINKLNKLEEKYSTGVPEDCFPEICNELQIDISIELPFCEKKYVECQSIKKRLRKFVFINTRLNHVNEVVSTDNVIEVDFEELYTIKKALDDDNKFYTYRKNGTNINTITTLEAEIRVKNDFSEKLNEFEIEAGLKDCKIDDIDDIILSTFVREGTHYNGTSNFKEFPDFYVNDDGKNCYKKHIDQKKAYTNFSMCKFYKGFLGKITDFRKTDKVVNVGLYRICELDFGTSRLLKYNNIMKIYLDYNVYSSPELEFLTEEGVKFKIIEGCWGVSPINFRFNETMINTKVDGISYYAKACGVWDSHNLEKRFNIKCDFDYFNIIKKNCEGVARYFDNGEATIAYKKKHNYHLGHITSFVTAYQRLNVFEQLFQFDYDNIIRVCVDGIFYTGELPELKNCFREKEGNINVECGEGYCSDVSVKNCYFNSNEYREHYNKELHLGAGGCGKTHMNCNDNGFIKPLFLAPSWKLARSKEKECNILCSVWARALTTDPIRISWIRERANVLIIDEVSMLSQESKEQFFKIYGDMKIIMCGDIGFQLPCIEGEPMNEEGFDNIVRHTNDYRCQDVKLNKIKTDLRLKMKEDFKEYTGFETEIINAWVIEQFKLLGRIVNQEYVENNYSVEDMILVGTNKLKDKYTELFSGKFDVEKYYVTENNRLYNNGQIIIGDKPEMTRCETRHAFTCHSIQGETAYHKLFIDAKKMFDPCMFYTAISRAKKLEQIFIIV
jgi:hypothetical protein